MRVSFPIQHRLLVIIGAALLFIIAEIVVGFRTHSLAVIADAFHYIGDLITFVISYIVERTIAKKRKTLQSDSTTSSSDNEAWWERSSIERIDTLAGFFNGSFLFALGLGILLQGLERFVQLEELNHPMMVMIMGCTGLAINIVSMIMLGGHHHGHSHQHDHRLEEKTVSSSHSHSWSVKAVSLHIICDAMNNAALILAATLIWKLPASGTPEDWEDPSYVDPKNYADPACTIFIAILIMVLSFRMTRDTGKLLLTPGPDGVA